MRALAAMLAAKLAMRRRQKTQLCACMPSYLARPAGLIIIITLAPVLVLRQGTGREPRARATRPGKPAVALPLLPVAATAPQRLSLSKWWASLQRRELAELLPRSAAAAAAPVDQTASCCISRISLRLAAHQNASCYSSRAWNLQ